MYVSDCVSCDVRLPSELVLAESSETLYKSSSSDVGSTCVGQGFSVGDVLRGGGLP